ncbi:MAG: response regulator [Verrucomicrobiota bacterium]
MDTEQTAKPGRARRLLVVDDDPAFSQVFKEFLLAHKPGAWVVHTAEQYAAALDCIREHALDLVILDLNMPVMDGHQMLRLLRRTHPELPLVVLTSAATPENRAQCLQEGAALFFDKTDVADGLDKIYAALESLASLPAASSQGFRGMLRQVGLTDVLQMECLGRKSSILEVTTPKASGKLYIQDGSIVHAEMGSVQGEKALFQLLGLTGGEFQLKAFSAPARQTIDGHWESLVMEAARLHDEATSEPAAPELKTPAPEAPQKPAAPPRHLHEIVLCSNTGELLYDWQSSRVAERIQMLSTLAKISGALARALSVPRADRLEVESATGRSVFLLEADRRVFVRSGNQPAKSAIK